MAGGRLLLVLAAAALVSCDSSEYDACTHSADSTTGDRRQKCAPSVFETKDVAWRDVSGIVWRGENGVQGAVVSFSPLASDRKPATTITGANGFFGPIGDVSLRYDMTTRIDRDLIVVRGLAGRYAQPKIAEDARSLTSAWVKRLDVQLAAPLAADRTLAFFTTGASVHSVTGDLAHGVSLVDRDFTSTSTLHVVEYEKGKDLSTATAYGKAEVLSTAGVVQLVPVRLEPIAAFEETKLTVATPPGFATPSIELVLAFSRSSLAHLTTMTPGVTKRLPVVPNHVYVGYRIRATAADGALTDSGETGFDFYGDESKVELVSAPVLELPAEGARASAATRLYARGTGVLEHVLVSEEGGGSIRIVTASAETALPDFDAVGATRPKGRYTWTVRSYPRLRFVDDLAGLDAGRYEKVGTSAPRVLVFE